MKSRTTFTLILLLLSATFVCAQKKHPEYEGTPEKDTRFTTFIKSNLGKIVHLKLSIANGEYVSEGYRGVQPYFERIKTSGIDYAYFLECKNNNDNLSPIEQCKDARWRSKSTEAAFYQDFLMLPE